MKSGRSQPDLGRIFKIYSTRATLAVAARGTGFIRTHFTLFRFWICELGRDSDGLGHANSGPCPFPHRGYALTKSSYCRKEEY